MLRPRLPFNPVPRRSGVSCGVVLSGVQAIRYVTPLREGGSLPAVMEADDDGTYVVKFRGAGQGRAALVAEVISAGIARACGLAVPDLVAVSLDPALAAGEPDQEIQDLLRASGGLNLGVDFLPGALDFETGAATVDPGLAGRIIWFDALISNADRSWRNPNMLLWHGRLYLIDHGAALTFHHRWASAPAAVARPYDIADHALLGCGARIEEADSALASRLGEAVLAEAVAAGSGGMARRRAGVRRRAGAAGGLRRAAGGPARRAGRVGSAAGRGGQGRAVGRGAGRPRRAAGRAPAVAGRGFLAGSG